MEQHLSWSKAYIVSAAVHFVIFLLLAVGLAVVVAEKEQQVYEIDLQASDFSQGSGHEGGGSAENLFPEPLKAEEVAKRVETVQQTIPPVTPTEAVVPTPDAVTVPQAASQTAAPSSDAAPAASPSGSGPDRGGGGPERASAVSAAATGGASRSRWSSAGAGSSEPMPGMMMSLMISG